MKQGHNRVGGLAVDQLKSIISRVERLDEEKAGIATDIRDVFAEAKGNGYCVKTIRKILKMRKKDASEREEEETILDTYLNALGMIPQFEMFDEAEEQEPDTNPAEGAAANDEEMYQQAVEVVVRDRKASTSYLQRMLKTGYNRAAQLIEQMESEGIVGPANHVGKREVLREPVGAIA